MSYDRFEDVMGYYPDHSWEPVEVTTSDGYILTMFHVWNQATQDATKGPVLFMHGSGMDGTDWLNWNDYPAPQFQIADLGHDVYIANNRGTEYSKQHTSLDYITDAAAYWDFTWADMAEDVLASVEGMYNHAGTGKGWYFGYSQGTIQMFVALTKYDSTLASNLHRTVLLAPCTILWDPEDPTLTEESMAEIGMLSDIGVYSVPSDDWASDRRRIRQEYGRQFASQFNRWNIDADQQPDSSKARDHWNQVWMTQRFASYVEDWAYPDNHVGEEYDLTSVTQTPVSLIVGENDSTCTSERADETAEQMTAVLQNYITILDEEHWFVGYSSESYVNILTNELTDTVAASPYYEMVEIWDSALLGPAAPLLALFLSFFAVSSL